MSIYEEFKKYGIQTDNHESDLYVPVTERTTEILQDYPHLRNVNRFINQSDGCMWYDIPFAFDPFWDKKQNIK